MLRGMQTFGFNASLASLAASLLALSGCVYGETRQVVRTQFSADVGCTEVHVQDRKPYQAGYKEGQLTASGCDVTRVYTCPADAGLVSYDDREVCTFETSTTEQPKTTPPPTGEPDMDDSDEPMDEPAEEPANEPKAEKREKAEPATKPASAAESEPAQPASASEEAKPTTKPATKSAAKPAGRAAGKAGAKGGGAKASGKLKLGK